MKTIIWDDKTRWEEAVKQGEEEEVVIVRDGRPVALLVPFDEEDLEWFSRERDPAFLESLADARKQVGEGKTISHDQLKAKLGI
ncbi:MAG TPA: hypothetical protein VH370_04390 [Humisphaera sp.]|jgi:antitoxin (DNA-binding transcriptional repressor) of toxin-antitoxin stability system|nr:hypothetical protein [Humisphaera sp.]